MLLTRIPVVRRKYYANVKTFPAGRLKKLVEHIE
jgi:hypothetical protein